jgi:hypothetical protein
VTRALQAVALGLLEDHLGHCVAPAAEQGGPEAEEKVREAGWLGGTRDGVMAWPAYPSWSEHVVIRVVAESLRGES